MQSYLSNRLGLLALALSILGFLALVTAPAQAATKSRNPAAVKGVKAAAAVPAKVRRAQRVRKAVVPPLPSQMAMAMPGAMPPAPSDAPPSDAPSLPDDGQPEEPQLPKPPDNPLTGEESTEGMALS